VSALEAIIARVREKARGRTRYYGQPPYPDEELVAEIDRLRAACSATNEAVCQTLGRTLGYPKFCDDQENFPGATEADGVCVGDHVAESIAEEAARKIDELRAAEAAAFRRGVEAMRRKAKEACRKVVVKGDSLDWRVAAKECRLAIAALPPPEDKG